ncbi:hypothetical protein ABK040_008710 [Willaertia magna]
MPRQNKENLKASQDSSRGADKHKFVEPTVDEKERLGLDKEEQRDKPFKQTPYDQDYLPQSNVNRTFDK